MWVQLYNYKIYIKLIIKGLGYNGFHNLNEGNKTFKFEKRHVLATPVPSSVYGWNYNDGKYIAENQNNNGMIQQLITKKD